MQVVLCPAFHLSDELVETVFYEVETIVNRRPVTKISDDPKDVRPFDV